MAHQQTVWDDPVFVSEWNRTYGLDMSGAKARKDLLFPLFEFRSGSLDGKALVDFGCGNGNLIKVFQKAAFARWTGVDAGSAVIASAINSVHDTRVRFLDQDISDTLTIDKHKADIATLFFVLEDLPNDQMDRVFANVQGALKQDGVAMIFSNHPAYALHHDWHAAAKGIDNEKFPGHRGYFDRAPVPFELGNLNQTQGFTIVPTYNHKTIADIMNAAYRNGLAVSHTIEMPSSVKTYAALATAQPVSGDSPRFLYLEMKPF